MPESGPHCYHPTDHHIVYSPRATLTPQIDHFRTFSKTISELDASAAVEQLDPPAALRKFGRMHDDLSRSNFPAQERLHGDASSLPFAIDSTASRRELSEQSETYAEAGERFSAAGSTSEEEGLGGSTNEASDDVLAMVEDFSSRLKYNHPTGTREVSTARGEEEEEKYLRDLKMSNGEEEEEEEDDEEDNEKYNFEAETEQESDEEGRVFADGGAASEDEREEEMDEGGEEEREEEETTADEEGAAADGADGGGDDDERASDTEEDSEGKEDLEEKTNLGVAEERHDEEGVAFGVEENEKRDGGEGIEEEEEQAEGGDDEKQDEKQEGVEEGEEEEGEYTGAVRGVCACRGGDGEEEGTLAGSRCRCGRNEWEVISKGSTEEIETARKKTAKSDTAEMSQTEEEPEGSEQSDILPPASVTVSRSPGDDHARFLPENSSSRFPRKLQISPMTENLYNIPNAFVDSMAGLGDALSKSLYNSRRWHDKSTEYLLSGTRKGVWRGQVRQGDDVLSVRHTSTHFSKIGAKCVGLCAALRLWKTDHALENGKLCSKCMRRASVASAATQTGRTTILAMGD